MLKRCKGTPSHKTFKKDHPYYQYMEAHKGLKRNRAELQRLSFNGPILPQIQEAFDKAIARQEKIIEEMGPKCISLGILRGDESS